MTRFAVTCLLALALSLASGPPARAQSGLKERSLNDAPAASHKPAPAATPLTAQITGFGIAAKRRTSGL